MQKQALLCVERHQQSLHRDKASGPWGSRYKPLDPPRSSLPSSWRAPSPLASSSSWQTSPTESSILSLLFQAPCFSPPSNRDQDKLLMLQVPPSLDAARLVHRAQLLHSFLSAFHRFCLHPVSVSTSPFQPPKFCAGSLGLPTRKAAQNFSVSLTPAPHLLLQEASI